jgi:hypothetical protein
MQGRLDSSMHIIDTIALTRSGMELSNLFSGLWEIKVISEYLNVQYGMLQRLQGSGTLSLLPEALLLNFATVLQSMPVPRIMYT